MHTIGWFILNAIRVNEEVLSFDLNALYIGGLPKIIVFNELNFLVVLLQNRCMLNLKIVY